MFDASFGPSSPRASLPPDVQAYLASLEAENGGLRDELVSQQARITELEGHLVELASRLVVGQV
jgi:hypothetical protein